MGSRGYFTVLRFRGIPVRIHWTTPIGALVASRATFAPGIWAGFVLLVLIHEAGHALVVRATRHEVMSIDVHALGGVCAWRGEATPIERAMIAWGGVWAQMALLAATAALLLVHGGAKAGFWAELAVAFTTVNVWLMCFNLLPVPPLDGANAWPLLGMLFSRWRRQKALERRAELLAARTGAKLRLSVVEATRRESKALLTMDQVDDLEHGVTPEVEAVLERVRTIAAEEGEREIAERSSRGGRAETRASGETEIDERRGKGAR